MRSTNWELTAPAGSFMSAYYAFEAGADAVYVGLRDFSARKSAQNFSFIELSKLKQHAITLGRKVYVALNTVIKQAEIDTLIHALASCSRIEIDGFIVQDFGALGIIRRHFPRTALHASTQMAVSNPRGIAAAAKLGVSRVILPRELSVDRVARLVREFPEMEFEVFIHGALCYSYSGLCLASGLLAGRSGNRGECAQVCRLEYVHEGRPGHYLSCRDLFSGRNLLRLAEAGVDSFKIEGRLKPPEYVYNSVKLYRYVLDRACPFDESEYETLLENSEFVFSREKTDGYLFGEDGERIMTSTYSRSTGRSIGRVEGASENSFSFKSDSALSVDDVLQVFLDKGERLPFKLPVRRMFVDGALVTRASRGAFVTVESGKAPEPGQEIFKVYAKDLELLGIRHKHFSLFKKALPIRIVFERDVQACVRIETEKNGKVVIYRHPCVFSDPKGHIDITGLVVKIFGTPCDTMYELSVREIENETNTDFSRISIQNRLLAKIRDDYLDFLERLDAESDASLAKSVRERGRGDRNRYQSREFEKLKDFVSRRENLNPATSSVPFYTGGPIRLPGIAACGNSCFIPLAPVITCDEDAYYDELSRFIASCTDRTIFLGINNIHHFSVLEELARFDNVFAFIDFFFYAANLHALDAAVKLCDRIAFGYSWVEGDRASFGSLASLAPFPLLEINPGFAPPYFFHAGGFGKESLGLDPTDADLREYRLIYGEYGFRVVESSGSTYIFLDEEKKES